MPLCRHEVNINILQIQSALQRLCQHGLDRITREGGQRRAVSFKDQLSHFLIQIRIPP